MWSASVTLSGNRIALKPLSQGDGPALVGAAADGELWNAKLTRIPDQASVSDYIGLALAGQDAGQMLPFVITIRGAGPTVGSIRYSRMDRANRTLEISHSWISASWQRSFVNAETNYLLLRHAFENLGCIRVQFQTDQRNERSQAAIRRLGATFEGVIRQDRIMADGFKRSAMLFSIIDDEWPEVRRNLERRLEGDSFSVEPVEALIAAL